MTLKAIIRRPYQCTLQDEVTVSAGECVHGAQAQKMTRTLWVLGESEGFIPIDCLREPGEDLSTCIAAKRLSSYCTEATFTAL